MLSLREVPPDQQSDRRNRALDRVARGRSRARFVELDQAREQVEELFDSTRERGWLHDVVDGNGDDVVGGLWAVKEGEELALYDVHLDDPRRVAELLAPLFDLARQHDTRRLGVGGREEDPTLEGLASLPGGTPRAANMALDLSRPIADPAPLELRPMTDEEFDEFFARMAEEYADTLVQTGLSKEAATERAREQTAQLVPSGLDSPGMAFFHGWVGEALVGRLWLAVDQPMAFVYDVEVPESQRRKGYGAGIMNAAAHWCRDGGHPVLGLNVFAHNPGARALYEKLGYRVTVDYRTFDVPDA
jgi:GNAT superfamily N-acetyltransferase